MYLSCCATLRYLIYYVKKENTSTALSNIVQQASFFLWESEGGGSSMLTNMESCNLSTLVIIYLILKLSEQMIKIIFWFLQSFNVVNNSSLKESKICFLLWLKISIQERRIRDRQKETLAWKNILFHEQKCPSKSLILSICLEPFLSLVNYWMISWRGKKSSFSKYIFVIRMGWEWILHHGISLLGRTWGAKFFLWSSKICILLS